MIFFDRKSGEHRKDELLEAARAGNEEKMLSLLTSTNVNCHASDGRKVSEHVRPKIIPFLLVHFLQSTPLHLAGMFPSSEIIFFSMHFI